MFSIAAYSKSVGWEPHEVEWPNINEVRDTAQKLLNRDDSLSTDEIQVLACKILEWYRFLPMASTDTEVAVINELYELFHKIFD